MTTGPEHGKEKFASALARRQEIFRQAAGRELAVFLDYDGTLTPIVSRPEEAVLDPSMRQTLQELARHCFYFKANLRLSCPQPV